MMKVQIFLIFIVLGNAFTVLAANPPTEVVVITSVVCGRCKVFASSDLKQLVAAQEYESTVKLTMLPTAHLRQTKAANGEFTYTHNFGADKVTECFYHFCANGLFSNDRALKFYTHLTNRKWTTIQKSSAQFFTDKTELAKLENCVNGPEGKKFAANAFELAKKNAYSGMLPFVVFNNRKYEPFENGTVLELVCKERTEKHEKACKGFKSKKEAQFKFLSTEWDFPQEDEEDFDEDKDDEDGDDDEIPEKISKNFDYEKFWNTKDEDEERNDKIKVNFDYENFWNTNDE